MRKWIEKLRKEQTQLVSNHGHQNRYIDLRFRLFPVQQRYPNQCEIQVSLQNRIAIKTFQIT